MRGDFGVRVTRMVGALVLAASSLFAQEAKEERLPIDLGSAFDRWLLAGLPSGREPWSLLRTAEATCVADRIESGGLFFGVPALLGVHGASWTDTTWQLGDVEITDPDRGGTPLVLVPAESLDRLVLTTALTPASAAGSGPRITLQPLAAAPEWHGDLALYTTPIVAQGGSDVAPPIARARAWDDVSLSGGGQAREGLSLFAALRGTRARREERGVPTSLRTNAFSALSQAVLTPNARDEWRLLAAASGASRPFAGRARFLDQTEREDHRAFHAQGAFTRRAEPGASAWRAALAYSHTHEMPPEPSTPFATVAVERLVEGPIPELYAPERRVRRLDALASATPAFLRFGDRNVATVGVSLERSSAAWNPVEGASSGLTAERVSGAPARIWNYGFEGTESRAHATRLSAFFEDRLSLGRRAWLEAGVRAETWRAASDTGPGRLAYSTLSPRVAVRWQPARVLGLFGGWERVHPRLALRTLWWGDPAAPQGRVFRWDDDGDRQFQANERGPLIARLGPGGPTGALDEDAGSPRTEGVVLGFDLAPGGGWNIRFDGVHRRARNLLESVELGVTSTDYRSSFVPDPSIDIVGPSDDRLLEIFARTPASFGRDRQLLTNVSAHDVLHEGVELVVDKRLGSPFFIRIGGTASRSTGVGGNRGYGVLENDPGVIGEAFEGANSETYSRGRMFFDRAYTLKIAGLWRPRDWSLGVVANYQDGQPFARMVLALGLPQGAEAIPAIRRSEHRFTYTLTVDARLARTLRVGKTHVALSVEAFNLLDMKNEVEEDVVWGAGFRTVTAVQPPRAVRFGLCLSR